MYPSLDPPCRVDLVLVRPDADHRHAKDILLLRPKAENTRDGLFHWRNPARVLQVAVRRVRRGNIWVFEPVWVSCSPKITLPTPLCLCELH